jgi:hypothetical protein
MRLIELSGDRKWTFVTEQATKPGAPRQRPEATGRTVRVATDAAGLGVVYISETDVPPRSGAAVNEEDPTLCPWPETET